MADPTILTFDVRNRIPGIAPRTLRYLDAATGQSAHALADYAKAAIETGPKTGKTYRRGAVKRRYKAGGKRAGQMRAMGLTETDPGQFIVGYRFHRASAPGEAPATDFHQLAASIHFRQARVLEAEAYAATSYAAPLEFGAPARDLAPRPYMRPAAVRVTPTFLALCEAAVRRGARP